MVEILFMAQLVRNPLGGDRAAMVLSRPVSRHARTAAMLGVQGYLTE